MNNEQTTKNHPVNIQNGEEIKAYLTSYKLIKKVKGLKVPVNQTNFYHKQLKKTKFLFQITNLDKIIDCPPTSKIILVEKDFDLASIQIFKNEKGQAENNSEIVYTQITLTYKVLSNQELLDLFTDGKVPFPNSFETIGHLAHYNLTTEQQPYHKVIGEITILKCLNITCVVNKTQKLHNIYRTPTLQMMAGIQNYMVKLKQVGTQFELDFQKVYWCSRLQQQRDRLLTKMSKGQLLADIFCGCGPLAVRAARKGLYVIANDLNPYGYEFLVHNAKLNKVQNRMICLNMCAREVIRKLYRQKQTLNSNFQCPDHIYMNLPVDAIQFLDVFINYAFELKTEKMPYVHVNCFVVADSDQKSKELIAQRISKTLPGFRKEDILEMNHIKNVTIIMRMYCVTFKLKKFSQIINDPKDFQDKKYEKGQKKVKPNERI